MRGEIYCKDCKHKCKEDVNDREVENLWDELFYRKENGKYQLDLWEANRYILMGAGIPEKNITVSKIASGVPMGTDLEYLDAMTLEMAFDDRKKTLLINLKNHIS